MEPQTLTFLLRGRHISMPDRVKRSDWPHSALPFADVVKHLVVILERDRHFPFEWEPPVKGKPVNETGTIERRDANTYVYRAARAQPSDTSTPIEVTEKVFTNAAEAARCYLRWDLHLPGDLDGWKVIE